MMVERCLPADFRYKGNRRKRGLRLPTRRSEGRSLDSFKHLATSGKNPAIATRPVTMAEHLKGQTNALDRRRRAWSLYTALLETLKGMRNLEFAMRLLDAGDQAKGHVPMKRARKSRTWSAERDYDRLSGCQSQWKGFKPQCCGGRAVAVPIACNHRLCPLCNSQRAERYRSRVQALFHELANPQLLTLTVPSPRKMSRECLDRLRTRLRAFLKAHKALLKGGVYSIEVTYNPKDDSWHPHVHVLVDIADPRTKIPWREFTERKWRLEFDWFLLTQGKCEGRRKWYERDWVEWCGGFDGSGRLRGPDAGRHRRVVDLRPVTKDKKAAYEVLKYMSKAATFVGNERALRQLLTAIRGVRQIQTFGSCYGFSVEEDAAGAAGHLQCGCGQNDFVSIGILGLGMVRLSPEGTWYVRDDAPVHGRQRCRGHST